MELIFATNNPHKSREIQALVPEKITILSLKDINFQGDIPENQATLEGNAREKACYIYEGYGKNCFADDTGLEIDALNGEPGVYSARYAGADKDPQANMDKVLKELEGIPDRRARFRCVISLIIDGEEKQFEGVVNGQILQEKRGSEGFGYDPIFLPAGYDKTFAEMPLELKNKISHRSQAINKLADYLSHYMDR
ncbi:MAG: non-canonical purine NTP diphosphatase [Bacteroidales bacterium]|nr:non-canonical purine NTP diphosphatase [Bacteroidales bacterium]MBS3775498.1 non-canonical purine NTP diphosphatase [Bacteroidales bacterium]